MTSKYPHLNNRRSGLGGGKSKVSRRVLKQTLLIEKERHTKIPLPTAAGTGLRLESLPAPARQLYKGHVSFTAANT